MRIVIDLQGAQSSGSRGRGIGRYSEALAYHICKHKGTHDVHLVLNYAFNECIEEIKFAFKDVLPKENFHVFDVVSPSNSLSPENEDNRRLNEAMREAFIAELNPDFVLITSLFEGLVDNATTSINQYTNLTTAVVLYDLIPYINRVPYLENPVVSDWYLKKINSLKQANVLLSISASSGQEAVNYLGFDQEKVINISTACDAQFVHLDVTERDYEHFKDTYNITRPFVMYTGGIDYRKNIEGLIRSFADLPNEIRNQYQLAVVCSVQETDRVRLSNLAKEYGLSKTDYIMTGFVPEEDLVKLYNACTLFIFPSWHEGFGLPALEAMKCGAPVIASNNSSLPEVVGLDEALFDPRNDEAITAKIKQGLTDEKFRERLVKHGIEQAKKFNWDDIAKTAIKAIETNYADKLSDKPQNIITNTSRPRPRLAFVSPLPPEHSGISDYSAELLRELTSWYDIDVVVNQDDVSDAWIKANTNIHTVEWFKEHSNEFDRVLYHFGNSEFHTHMFDLLAEIPGVIVLHDFYLSGIQSYRDAMGWAPNAWKQNLYHSHGYNAVKLLENETYPYEAIWTYPTNLKVIQDSLGIIVHSQNSVEMAKEWYSEEKFNWQVIPLLKNLPHKIDKKVSREKLGYEDNKFLICSFGIIGENKASLELIQAFMSSKLASNPNVLLILVGQLNPSDYETKIINTINDSGLRDRIIITGWNEIDDYKTYLQAADIAVQLRTLSRGETSAAVLDCMAYGIPTIINANGSMAYIDSNSVIMISDNFEQSDLVSAMEELYKTPSLREKLSKQAITTIQSKHNPQKCAKAYYEVIESTYSKEMNGMFGLLNNFVANDKVKIDNKEKLSKLAINFPTKPHIKQIFIDITVLVQTDAKSGIQRVVRAILLSLLNTPPAGYRIEPVYSKPSETCYYYARKFTSQVMGISENWAYDTSIDFATGDIFLGLDLHPDTVESQFNYYKMLKAHGIKIAFIVYDILPVLMPSYFPEGTSNNHYKWISNISEFDKLICISQSVADEVYEWLEVFGGKDRTVPLEIDWFHLGADLENSLPSKGMPTNASELLKKLKTNPSFLSVGTIEPRKGHNQIFEAFEKLWNTGAKANLVLVGKGGWKTEALIKKIATHSQLNKQLFWLEGISDEYLEKIYAACDCLIAASYGEGFGLPLIEAAQYNLPIIARDIPVFREVAGQHAEYFDDSKDPTVIAEAVKQWLSSHDKAAYAAKGQMPWLTWEQSTQQLLNALLDRQPAYKVWVANDIQRFWGNDPRSSSKLGVQQGQVITSDGKEGFLSSLKLTLNPGTYKLRIKGDFNYTSGKEYIVLVNEDDEEIIFKKSFSQLDQTSNEIAVTLSIMQKLRDAQMKIWVNKSTIINIREIALLPIADIDSSNDNS